MQKFKDWNKPLDVVSSAMPSIDVPALKNIKTPSYEVIECTKSLKYFRRPDYYMKSVVFDETDPAYQISSDDIDFYNSMKPNVSLKAFEKLLQTWETISGINKPIQKDKALKNSKFLDLNAVESIYNYWISKRLELGHSLIREFWMGVDKTDENLNKVFCKRKGNKMRLRSIKIRELQQKNKIQRLYCNLNESKEIVLWIIRREYLKLLLVKLAMLEFESRRAQAACLEFGHTEYDEVITSTIIEQSKRYRDLKTYKNHYARIYNHSNT